MAQEDAAVSETMDEEEAVAILRQAAESRFDRHSSGYRA